MDLLKPLAVAPALGLVACAPNFDDDLSRIDAPRLLAVRSVPAEAAPREAVSYEALISEADATLAFAHCTARKTLSELGPVSQRCLAPSGPALIELAGGSGALPEDACRLFGPQLPEPEPGEPAGRPTDPDFTGGFFQPVRVTSDALDAPSFGATRLTCDPSGVTGAQAREIGRRARRNAHPSITSLTAVDGTDRRALESSGTASLPARAALRLELEWPSCPLTDTCGDGVCGIDDERDICAADCATPVGCGGAERYLYFDPVSRSLIARRESLTATWYATDGTFEAPRTGRDEGELEPRVDVGFNAPGPGPFTLWVVLRDARGGVDWARFDLIAE